MSRQSVFNTLAFLLAVLASAWRFALKPVVQQTLGIGRVLESINNSGCTVVPELQACEKIVLHQPSGVIYLACSTPEKRVQWTPILDRLNDTNLAFDDYIATYDHKTSRITKFKIKDFKSTRGLFLHGMDVVPSSSNPKELFVYLVNHRPPVGAKAKDVGSDSVIEIFKTKLGSDTLTHIKTIEDPSVIISPNDVVGSADGTSFYFTNDHGEKLGLIRNLDFFNRKSSSVGYCHVDEGCHFAYKGMNANNGIAKSPNGTVYVGNSNTGAVTVLEEQTDHTLVLTDMISIVDRPLDNLAIDAYGQLWAAGFPKGSTFVFSHMNDPSIPSPSSAHRISINTNPAEIPYGIKYKADKLFEDDGSIASGITSAVYDAERNWLFMNGIAAPRLVICKI